MSFKKNTIALCFYIVLWNLSLLNSGCYNFDPVKVKGREETFRFPDNTSNMEIAFVALWQCDENKQIEKLVWEIESENKIYAKDFEVQVGKIPYGFFQIIPVPPEIFVPTNGMIYKIFIIPRKLPYDFYPRGTLWIPCASPTNSGS